jgi:hypothetical protein
MDPCGVLKESARSGPPVDGTRPADRQRRCGQTGMAVRATGSVTADTIKASSLQAGPACSTLGARPFALAVQALRYDVVDGGRGYGLACPKNAFTSAWNFSAWSHMMKWALSGMRLSVTPFNGA